MLPLVPSLPYTLSRLDACAWLKDQADGSIDLIVTDYAYESIEKHRAVGTTTRLQGQWFQSFPNSRLPELFTEMFRVLKKNSHLYFFCDHETMFVAKPIAEEAGFTFWNPIVWNKKHFGGGYHYRRMKEFVLFFEKGKRKLNDLSVPDVLEVPMVHGGYPTQKPKELIDILIQNSSKPGEVVADPFFGSGTTADSALSLGRGFTGTDISEHAHAVARERLSIYKGA